MVKKKKPVRETSLTEKVPISKETETMSDKHQEHCDNCGGPARVDFDAGQRVESCEKCGFIWRAPAEVIKAPDSEHCPNDKKAHEFGVRKATAKKK